MNKKKFFATLAVAFAMLCPTTMQADELKWYLVALDADGIETDFEMNQVGSLVAVDDAYDFSVLDASGNVLAENVSKVTFRHGEQGADAIRTVHRPDNNLIGAVKDKLTLVGISGKVSIYDAAGTLCSQVVAEGNDTVVNVAGLSAGVYIVKAGKQTFKFIKK